MSAKTTTTATTGNGAQDRAADVNLTLGVMRSIMLDGGDVSRISGAFGRSPADVVATMRGIFAEVEVQLAKVAP